MRSGCEENLHLRACFVISLGRLCVPLPVLLRCPITVIAFAENSWSSRHCRQWFGLYLSVQICWALPFRIVADQVHSDFSFIFVWMGSQVLTRTSSPAESIVSLEGKTRSPRMELEVELIGTMLGRKQTIRCQHRNVGQLWR